MSTERLTPKRMDLTYRRLQSKRTHHVGLVQRQQALRRAVEILAS